jgi:hypothetical protein
VTKICSSLSLQIRTPAPNPKFAGKLETKYLIPVSFSCSTSIHHSQNISKKFYLHVFLLQDKNSGTIAGGSWACPHISHIQSQEISNYTCAERLLGSQRGVVLTDTLPTGLFDGIYLG